MTLKIYCPSCSSEIRTNSDICPSCGMPLNDAATVSYTHLTLPTKRIV